MDDLKDITASAAHLARAMNSYISTRDYEGTKKTAMEARIIRFLEDGMIAASKIVNAEDDMTVEDAAAFENFHVTRSQVMALLVEPEEGLTPEPSPEPSSNGIAEDEETIPEVAMSGKKRHG